MKAINEYGRELPTWDEGLDDSPLFVYRESLGVVGVVCAMTWEDAWECVVDEILSDADPKDPDNYARSYDDSADESDLAEGVYWRNNGVPSNPNLKSPMCYVDLNGHALDETSVEALAKMGVAISLDGEFYDCDPCGKATPIEDIATVRAYGIETNACPECRA